MLSLRTLSPQKLGVSPPGTPVCSPTRRSHQALGCRVLTGVSLWTWWIESHLFLPVLEVGSLESWY